MHEDIRTYARLQLATSVSMTRAEFVQLVRAYAIEKYGQGEAVMHAERTARHLWDSR